MQQMVGQQAGIGQHQVVASVDFFGNDFQFGGEGPGQGGRERGVAKAEEVAFVPGQGSRIDNRRYQVGQNRLGCQPGESSARLRKSHVVEKALAGFGEGRRKAGFSFACDGQVSVPAAFRDYVDASLAGNEHGGGQENGFVDPGGIFFSHDGQPKTGDGMSDQRETVQFGFANESVRTLQIGFDGYLGGRGGIAFSAGQIQGKSPMTSLLQFVNQRFPAPGAMGPAMNQQKIHTANIANVGLLSNVLLMFELFMAFKRLCKPIKRGFILPTLTPPFFRRTLA